MEANGGFWDGAEVISVYTRKQALEDGVLAAVPDDLLREAGFRFPVALTAAAWVEVVEPTEREQQAGQSVTGRLWDVLMLLKWAINRSRGGSQVRFPISVDKEDGRREFYLRSTCGPGDDMEPVITIEVE